MALKDLKMTFTREEFNDDNFDKCFKDCGKGNMPIKLLPHKRRLKRIAKNQTQKGCWLNCRGDWLDYRAEKALADSLREEQNIDSGRYNNNKIDVTNADWAQLNEQGGGRRRKTRIKRRRKIKRRRNRRRRTRRRRRKTRRKRRKRRRKTRRKR